MLRIDGRRHSLMLSKAIFERPAPEIRYETAPSVPLIARDSYVAETASKIEQLQATMRLMSRDLAQIAGAVADLQQTADQEKRWQTFQLGEKRSRDTKLDELLRGCRDLKARLDRIESCSKGDFHAYHSFEAVSRKLAELETFPDYARRIERSLKLRSWVLAATIAAGAAIIVLANTLAA